MTFFNIHRLCTPPSLRFQQAYIITAVKPYVNHSTRFLLLQHQHGKKTFTTSCLQYSKQDQFQVSHPRLYKVHEKLRIGDNLSKEWQLIYAPNRGQKNNWKAPFAYWMSFFGLCILPLGVVWGWVDLEMAEKVDTFGIEMEARTQFIMFALLNAFIVSNIYRYFHCVPKRIYFNPNSDKYLILNYHYLPWKLRKLECKATDLQKYTGLRIMFRFNPMGLNEYQINNKSYIFPHSNFRSGFDRDHMLRFANSS